MNKYLMYAIVIIISSFMVSVLVVALNIHILIGWGVSGMIGWFTIDICEWIAHKIGFELT